MLDMRTNSEAPSNFNNLDTQLMNCYQKCKGTRTLIDIDFDIPEDGEFIPEGWLVDMRANNAKCHVIKTRSGYHVLIEKESLKFNYVALTKIANDTAQSLFDKEHVEVEVNKNAMVPIPGTMQAGFKVCFLDI